MPPKVKYAYIDPSGWINCAGEGEGCTVWNVGAEQKFWLVHPELPPEKQQNFFDDSLSQLVDKINNLLSEEAKKKTDRRLGLLTTPIGIMPVWVSNTPYEKEEGRTNLDSDDKIMKAFNLKETSE